MTANVKVSVIIPTWNDCKRVLMCIDAIKSQTIPRNLFEVIVVDNGSSDDTIEVLSSFKDIILLEEKKVGSYAARNRGLSIAKGEYVAFTDSDCIPDERWLEALLKVAEENENFGVVAGKISFFKDKFSNADPAALNYESFFSMNQEEYVKSGLCITANWLSERKKLIQHGLFNDSLKSGGDHDMARRLSKNNLKVLFSSEAIVRHPSRNFAEILSKRRRVIGGAWDIDKTSGKSLRMTIQALKLFLKRTLLIIFVKRCSFTKKASVLKVLVSILIVSLHEIIRLSKGKKSSRC